MELDAMVVFAKVVQAGSFTAAAAALGLPKSTVSRKVTALEARLGVRLLSRTTRRLGLTDAGRTYHAHCARIASAIDEADRAIRTLQETPRGHLRVTTPLNFAFLGPIVADFLRRCPEVALELVCTDRVVDIVDEGFDVAIRAGPLADTSLVARRLATARSFLVASPSYLRRRGRPKTPADLAAHACLRFGSGEGRAGYRLVRGHEALLVTFEPRLVVNDMDVLHAAALDGAGIAMLPAFRCVADLRARRLERVLREHGSPEIAIHAVVPSARHVTAAMRAFLDHLQARMTPPPWETGPVP